MSTYREPVNVSDPNAYDDDASSFHPQDSEVEEVDPINDDEEILREDDERETLLSERSSSALPKHLNVVNSKKEQRQWQRDGRSVRKAKRRTRRGDVDGDGGATYEMEEGGTRSDISSQSSRESVVPDLNKSDHGRNRLSKVLPHNRARVIANFMP